MTAYKIALYPGDGIGLEVTPEAVRVMEAAAIKWGFRLAFTEFDWGHRYWLKTGRVVPEDFLEILKGFDAVFLGALGDPGRMPDYVSLMPLIAMRQSFDQYACVRPAAVLPGIKSPLADAAPDLVVIRENSEGEYVNLGGFLHPGGGGEAALQTALHTRSGISRILRYAFKVAGSRNRRLTMATKSNALGYAMVLWDRILEELTPEFPDVKADKVHIDALTMIFVRNPAGLDVVVGSNLFGDILSDLAGALTGGIGLAPSANINPEKKYPSLFEPVHGSAPDIAGRGVANPAGAIRSAAMLLDFLGEKKAAAGIERAVRGALSGGGGLTPDLGGRAGTAEMGAGIAACLQQAE